MKLVTINNTAYEIGVSPFFPGGEAIFYNQSEAQLIVQGSADGSTGWATLATVPANDMVQADELPAFVRVSTAASLRMLG